MTYKIYNMNAGYYTQNGVYSLETQFEMSKEIGFDGLWIALWSNQAYDELKNLSALSKKYDVEVTSVYAAPELHLGLSHPKNERILQMLETLEGATTVEIGIQTIAPGVRPSDPAGDEIAITWLNKALEIAERRNITLLLYNHLSFWVEQAEDAARLCQQINHPNLGIVFSAFHWYATRGFDIDQTLETIKPYLKQVSLAGSRKDPNGFGGVATIEPLDGGTLDNFVILAKLKKMGFDGKIGFLTWDWGGDLYSKLERSLKVFREMEERVKKFPHWAELERPY